MKTKKSPVVYWTSKWVPTGETEVHSDRYGNKIERPKKILEGQRNPSWRGNK